MKPSEKLTLGAVVNIKKGKKHSVSQTLSETTRRLIMIDDLRNDDLIHFTNDQSGTESAPNDILIAWDGVNAGTVGFGKSGFIGSTIARLRFKEDNQFYTPFLGAFLKSKFDYLRRTTTGATIPHINRQALEGIILPTIDLDDQKRIAYLLSKVEKLIGERRSHLQQLDDLLKSVFLEMFGDPISNPKGFPVRKLSEFYISPEEGTKCGPFGSALKKEELVESGIPVWNMDNIHPTGRMVLPFRMWITKEKYQELRAYSVKDGDIIISRAGTVGKMCVAQMNDFPAIISTNLIRLRLNSKLRPMHVVCLMTYCKGRVGRLKTGSDGAFTHMNTGILDRLEFPYPDIELQDKFFTILQRIESIKSLYQASLADLETLYGALSQKAFKGELDLSRVPLIPESAEMTTDKNMEPKDPQPTPETVNFSAPSDLTVLNTTVGRQALLEEWLNVWLEHLNNEPFSPQPFLDAAQQRLSKLTEDNSVDWELGSADYEQINDWLIKSLNDGKLEQIYENAKKQVQVKAVHP